MALLIKGKTTCQLCGKPIQSQGDAVGLPSAGLLPELKMLGDSCLHRTCLMNHPQHADLVRCWSAYWRTQAQLLDGDAMLSEYAFRYFVKKRFVYLFHEDFIEIEEQRECADDFGKFVMAVECGENRSLTLGWNRYDLTVDETGAQLVMTPNIRAASASVTQSSIDEVLRHHFSPPAWKRFVQSWARFGRAKLENNVANRRYNAS